jgi:hypothetical protein
VGPSAKVAAQMGIDQVVSVIGDLEKQMREEVKKSNCQLGKC